MKRFLIIAAALMLALPAAAEKIIFSTGNVAGTSLTDKFMPQDFSMLGTSCTVSAVFRTESGMWCIRLSAVSGERAPVVYEYFVQPGDNIRMRRLNESGLSECALTVTAVTWNRAELTVTAAK